MTHHDADQPLHGIDGNITRGQAVEIVSGTIAEFLRDALTASRAWHTEHDAEQLGQALAVAYGTLTNLGGLLRHIVESDDREDAIEATVAAFSIPDFVDLTA